VSLFQQAGFLADTKNVPRIQRPQDKYFVADMFSRTMDIGNLRGVAVDVSTVHDFHGSSDNPTLNGTLLHQDLDLALCQRARAKVEKYRAGYAAHPLRHAFLPAIVSTSGRIHGELLRLLFNLADKKTSNSLEALGEAIDVESEVYCRRRSGRMRIGRIGKTPSKSGRPRWTSLAACSSSQIS